MDRPFKELHEIYRIVYLKAEKQAQAEEERKAKEAEEKKKKERERSMGSLPSNPMYQNRPTDVMPTNQMDTLSPAQAEALQDALEDIM